MTYIHQFRSTHFMRMASSVLLLTLTFGLAACSSAPEEVAEEPEMAEETVAESAEGWMVRADGGQGGGTATMEGTDIHIVAGGPPPENGTWYNPAWTHTGDYSFSATLTQNNAATHRQANGLMFGGMNLDGPDQMYSYFVIDHEGNYAIINRDGESTAKVVDWTPSDALMTQGETGGQTNTLAMEVAEGNVMFWINGTEVETVPAADLHTDGMYGFRVGHRLDITVSDVTN